MFIHTSYSQKVDSTSTVFTDTLKIGDSKSGYDSIPSNGGAKSVNAELRDDNTYKNAWIQTDISKKLFNSYYRLKKNLKSKRNLAIGADYNYLNQYASFSYSKSQATSGIFRFFGTLELLGSSRANYGALVFKIENRHSIGTSLTPRDLGYEAGSALSTATFKHFSWGLTNLYWKHLIKNKFSYVVGIMDPGDWIDLYPLLNPFKYYLNEAFFNSPAMALPNQGLGVVVAYQDFIPNFYVAAGIHDANGEPTYYIFPNIESFFNTHEYFYWAEIGWNPNNSILGGETVHLTYWYQDARRDKQTEITKGWCFSGSKVIKQVYTGFFRAAISEGNAATMHHLVKGGLSRKVVRSDRVGLGVSWGGPADRSRRDQWGIELFYSLQLTEHLNLTPDVQLTVNPSFNEELNVVGVYSVIRIRYAI